MRGTPFKILAVAIISIVFSSHAHAFARQFNQDNNPGVFHSKGSSAELCLFVSSRQGALMIQPHCMVSSSSHNIEAITVTEDSTTLASE